MVLACGPVPARTGGSTPPLGRYALLERQAPVDRSVPSSWAYIWSHLDASAWSSQLDRSYGI